MTAANGPGRLKSFAVAVVFFGYNAFVSHLPVYRLRHLYLRLILRVRLGKGASVHMGCFFTGRHISIGDHSVINRGCFLDGRGGITIGSNASISPDCSIVSLTHDVNHPDFGVLAKPVVIGDYAWVGMRAMILPGVELGEGAVVGAGSVVTRSCAAYDIVAGSPAGKIGERKKGLRYTLSYFPLFNTDVQP